MIGSDYSRLAPAAGGEIFSTNPTVISPEMMKATGRDAAATMSHPAFQPALLTRALPEIPLGTERIATAS
jgi:hypothetical protein